MNTRLRINTVKLAMISALFIYLVASSDANAQRIYAPKMYRGLTAGFGTNTFRSNSNIRQINRDRVTVAGGQVGITLGTDMIRYDVGLIGYYSSVSNIAGTVDFYTNSLSAKFFPLSLLSRNTSIVQPYFIGGVSYDRYKFSGHFMSGDGAKVNYSAEEPYVGAIKQTNASIGAGFEVKIISHYDFVHLFTDVKYSYNVSESNTRSEFDQTSLSGNVSVNVGLSFGLRRQSTRLR